ncbi:penicillin-binding protein activator [Luteimonas sp. MHLX1A]|uniref:penicillin-binding protein activator n=1 Tax=Alterluteimonas muca TaxID=2878684 RepID=UPI001E48257A|nr:penicillin-binding protein activator [Luteimonas sp. MHLX1A]MCD9047501.1 penicillin-binding protein activator [Luteimonas sp. MHLX1A]
MRNQASRLSRTLLLTAALLLAGCASVTFAPTAPPPVPTDPNLVAANELAQRYPTLRGPERAQAAQAIEQLLSTVPDQALTDFAAGLPEGDPMYAHAGRVLQARGLPLPRPYDLAALWAVHAGNRPPADHDGYRPPMRLGVLLPLSGNLATAAAPVRDGLLAGYYGERRNRPELVFYDTAGGAGAAYERAVTEGADYVLGPLGQDEVAALLARPDRLQVPVLALNRAGEGAPAGSFSFALAPEDDGTAAADYLLARNVRQVLVLNGGDGTARRSVDAFRKRLEAGGGAVSDMLVVTGETPADMTEAMRTAMLKDNGAQAVFLALRVAQARAIAPQLVAAGFATRPRIGTSQLYSSGRSEQDSVLDGIVFPTERWAAAGVAGLPMASTVASSLPTARGPAARLFAFGYDAWLLTAFMERLVTGDEAELRGATGLLRIDGEGNIVRAPSWATFTGGHVVPVADR